MKTQIKIYHIKDIKDNEYVYMNTKDWGNPEQLLKKPVSLNTYNFSLHYKKVPNQNRITFEHFKY